MLKAGGKAKPTCTPAPSLRPPRIEGEGLGVQGAGGVSGESLTAALLTPDCHGAHVGGGGGQGQAGEQQAHEAGGPQLHPQKDFFPPPVTTAQPEDTATAIPEVAAGAKGWRWDREKTAGFAPGGDGDSASPPAGGPGEIQPCRDNKGMQGARSTLLIPVPGGAGKKERDGGENGIAWPRARGVCWGASWGAIRAARSVPEHKHPAGQHGLGDGFYFCRHLPG